VLAPESLDFANGPVVSFRPNAGGFFMGLIADLLGSLKGEAATRTIADVEAALGRLGSSEAIADTASQRDELLLEDESDVRIGKLDSKLDKIRLVLERCDKAEPLLLSELGALRTRARRALWDRLRAGYDDQAVIYAAALRSAVEKLQLLVRLNEDARRQGFEAEVMAAFIPPTRMVSAEALLEFESRDRAGAGDGPEGVASGARASKGADAARRTLCGSRASQTVPGRRRERPRSGVAGRE
jgi:hypothetical protein